MLRMNMMLVSAASALVFPMLAPAAVTPIAYYRLGEADPGASAGTLGQNPTRDSAGTFDLARNGTPTYSSNVSSTAAANVGSTLSMDFDGAGNDNDRYNLAAAVPTPATNWGIEAFVQADTADGVAVIAYNGNSGGSGMGLYLFQGNYVGLVGGKAFVGSTPAGTGNWVHLAMVTEPGNSTFYVNGVAAATGPHPNTAADFFNVGGRSDNGELFNGRIDEVRVFTFSEGQFSTDDLLVNVPEPSALALLGVAGVLALRRRR